MKMYTNIIVAVSLMMSMSNVWAMDEIKGDAEKPVIQASTLIQSIVKDYHRNNTKINNTFMAELGGKKLQISYILRPEKSADQQTIPHTLMFKQGSDPLKKFVVNTHLHSNENIKSIVSVSHISDADIDEFNTVFPPNLSQELLTIVTSLLDKIFASQIVIPSCTGYPLHFAGKTWRISAYTPECTLVGDNSTKPDPRSCHLIKLTNIYDNECIICYYVEQDKRQLFITSFSKDASSKCEYESVFKLQGQFVHSLVSPGLLCKPDHWEIGDTQVLPQPKNFQDWLLKCGHKPKKKDVNIRINNSKEIKATNNKWWKGVALVGFIGVAALIVKSFWPRWFSSST